MKRIILILIAFIVFLVASIVETTGVSAGNPPDPAKSSISGNSAPADGSTYSSVTIVLRDASGNNLTGNDWVTITSSNTSTSFDPSTVTLDGSGTFYVKMRSTYVGNVPITVTDKTTANTQITGSVTFYTPGTLPPPSGACTDPAPGSTAQLTSAVSTDAHSITLTWTDATNPVTYYLTSYGVSSGNYIYGNPNIGPQGTTSYTVGGLSTGTKYYFVIRAGNGCTPGSYSNELSAVAGASAATPTPATTTIVTTPTPPPPTSQTIQTITSTPTPTPTLIPVGQSLPGVPAGSPPGGVAPTPAPTGGLSVGMIVLVGTVLGILIFVGIGIWMLILYRRSHRPPPIAY